MATILYDGTSNQTASKATDTVILTANPANFTGAAESNGNVVLTFGTNTLTVTGTTLSATGLSNVSIPNGNLIYSTSAGATSNVAGNTLAFLLGASTTTVLGGNNTTTSSVSAAFGGLGRADSLDNAETITIAADSKGSYLIYGNEGIDSIGSASALGTNTATTVFGGRGSDTINFSAPQSGAGSNFALYGGEGGDSIILNHTATTGNVTIFGDTAAADANGGNDTIILGTDNAGSSFNVFAAGGDDIITSDGTNGGGNLSTKVATFVDSTTATFFGGSGNDTISVGSAAKATLTVYGGAGNDSIYVTNAGGTTTVYGGTGAADPNDGADNITVAGSGAFTVYANSGNDQVTATGLSAAATGTTTLSVFGGRGDDQITAGSTSVKANLALFGSENASDGGDVISAFNFKGGSTIIYGGTAAADAADGADSISFSGQGTTTIYAAGGNDSVSIKGLSSAGFADSVSTDTIFGGGGNDSITISGSQITNGTHTVTLGDGADIFVAGSRADSALNTAPTLANKTDGGTGATAFETVDVTFTDLTAGNSVVVGGITFKTNVDLTGAQLAGKFAAVTGTSTTASLNANVTDGVFTVGTQPYAFAASNLNNATITTTATTNGNKTDLATDRAAGAANGSGQTIDIRDFTLSQGDTLVVQNGTGNAGTLQTVDASGAQTIQAALDLAVAGVNNTPLGAVSAVVFQGNAYVVVNNDANNTFNANTDLAIKLTGVNTLTGLSAATTIV